MPASAIKYVVPDWEAMSHQLRTDFYRREKEPRRREIHARFRELGVRVGAHKKTKKEEEE